MTQSVEEQVGTIPAIETEFHLFQVGREMLDAHAMPRSHDAALEQRESGFDGVGMHVSVDVLPRVIDGLVDFLSILIESPRIDSRFVGNDHFHIFANVLRDYLFDLFRGCLIDANESEIATTFTNADHNLFVLARKSATRLAANVGFINLHDAIQHHFLAFDHGRTDAMTEVPRGLVAHSDRALDLASRHSLFRFAEQVRREEPFRQRQVRVIENGSRSNGELVVAVFAVEELLFRLQLDHGPLTAQALRAFRKAQANEQFTALVFGTEKSVYIN